MCEDGGDHLFSEIFFAPHPYCQKMGDTRLKRLLMNEGEPTYEEDFFRCGESQMIGTGDEKEDENGLGGNGGKNMDLDAGEDDSEFFLQTTAILEVDKMVEMETGNKYMHKFFFKKFS